MTESDQQTQDYTAPDQFKDWQKRHLVKLLKNELDLDRDEDLQLTEEPDSQIQALVKETFTRLQEMDGNPDTFDRFYTEELEDYNAKHLYADFIEQVLSRVNVKKQYDHADLKTEEVEDALYRIAEHVTEERDALDTVAEIIEDKYPNLVTQETEGMTAEEYHSRYESFVESQVEKMAQGIEPKEDFKEYFTEFEALNNNNIDTVASQLNTMVDIGNDVWKLVLYSALSAPAEKIQKNGRPMRSSLHTMLIGDISTAKSQVLNIVKDIQPNYAAPTSMTKASFIGAYDTEEKQFQEGIVDRIQDGNLIVEEFDKIEYDDGQMRQVFDNSDIEDSKGQDTKYIPEIRTSVIAGANPKDDFFTTEEQALRGQIPFKEGELSRFDVLIPLVNTTEQMDKYVDDTTFFGGGEHVDMTEIRQMMNALNTKIQNVDTVEISPEQAQRLKNGYKELQEELDENDHRPTLLIMRDLETLQRLAYVIGCVYEPVEDGTIRISEGTVSKALSQFNTLIDLRKKLYVEEDRARLANTTKDEVYWEAVKMTEDSDDNEVLKKELKERCIRKGIVNSKQVCYSKIDELIKEERVVETKDGEPLEPDHNKRYTSVKPVA